MLTATEKKKKIKSIVPQRDCAYLQLQLGVCKQTIREAIAAVGNNRQRIEQYLCQKNWAD